MGYGKRGEILRAEREILDGPAAEDYALVPRSDGIWGHGLNGFCDEAHDLVGVVIELKSFRSGQSRDA